MRSPIRALRQDQDRWLLLLTTALWGCVLVAYTVLTPVWRSPDEVNHFDLVVDVSAGRGYAAWDEDQLSGAVVESSRDVRDWPPRVPIADDLRPLPPVPDSPVMSGRANHMTQHPPGYYGLLGAELRVMDALGVAPEALSAQLALMRVVSAVLVLPLPLLAWLLVRTLRMGRDAGRVALLLPVAVPGLAQVGSGVSNDALLLLLFSGLAVLLARFQQGHRSRGVVIAIGLVCGVALFTKAFGAAALLWALLVVAASFGREGGARRALAPAAAVVGIAFALGGWWYLRNVVRDGRVLPSLEEARFSVAPPGAATGPQVWIDGFFPVAGRGFFGLLGYVDVSIGDLAYRLVLLVSVVLVGAGVVAVRRDRSRLALLAAPLPILLVLQASQSYRLYESSGVVALGHGRYLLPAFLPCAALAVTALDRPGRWVRLAAPAVLLMAVAVHVHLWGRALAFFWSTDGPRAALTAAVDWSPLPRLLSIGALGAIVPLTLLLLVGLLRVPRPLAPATAPAPSTPFPVPGAAGAAASG